MSELASVWYWGLLIVLAIGVVYDEVALAALRHWLREPASKCADPLTPITFFRPLKRGVPQLREKIEALITASLAGDQILFGVDPGSEEEALCREVRRSFPDRDIAVIRCEPGARRNPKISKLVQMEAAAGHGAWLLSDSEAIFEAAFLAAFRSEWQAKGCAVLTAGYRFVNLVSGPQRCDALAVLLGLWPGLALVRRFGRVRFTLGACTLVRREALAAAGGWGAFGNDLAEDHQLGVALAKAGETVHLSRQIVTLDSDAMSWREYWRHQRRVAVTYRAASPAGFAGMVITHGLFWCAVCGLAMRLDLIFFLALAFAAAIRALRTRDMAEALDCRIARLRPLWIVASVVEALCWVLSWFSAKVWWSGRWWRVDFRGKLSAIEGR